MFGIKILDNMIGKLEPKQVTIISSMMYGGRTTLGLQAVYQALKNKKNCLIVSLEFGEEQFKYRFEPFVPFMRKSINNFNKNEGNLLFLDDVISTADWIRTIKEITKSVKLDLIMIDYFELMIDEREYLDPEAQLEVVLMQFKNLSEVLNVPIIITKRLISTVSNKDVKNPTIDNIKIPNVKKYADNIIILHKYDENNHVKLDLYRNDNIKSCKLKWNLYQEKYMGINNKTELDIFQYNIEFPTLMLQKINDFAEKFYKFAKIILYKKVSITGLQRHLGIGFRGAKAILDDLLEKNIIVRLTPKFCVIDKADKYIEYAYIWALGGFYE